MDTNTARAATLDTATLSDALDRLGIVGQCYKIAPCDSSFRMAGRAITILYGPSAKPSGTVGDYIDDVTPGSVIVLDNGGREDATVWGDILKGDADGVIVIPKEHEDAILSAAEEIHEAEVRIRAAVRGGSRLDNARAANRYHQLQTSSEK
jgi:regulator of RNase E activity RraA